MDNMELWVKEVITLEEVENKVGKGLLIEKEVHGENEYLIYQWYNLDIHRPYNVKFLSGVVVEMTSW